MFNLSVRRKNNKNKRNISDITIVRNNLKVTTAQIVILGSSGAGKTTIFNFLTNSDVLRTAEHVVGSNTIKKNNSAPTFVSSTSKHHRTSKDNMKDEAKPRIFRKLLLGSAFLIKQCKIDPKTDEVAKLILDHSSSKELEFLEYKLKKEIAVVLNELWSRDYIKDKYEEVKLIAEFEDFCHLEYFLENLRNYPDYGGANWCPELEDLLRCTYRTTGKRDEEVMLKQTQVTITDVSGARCERRKWKLYFKNIIDSRPFEQIVVLFVVPLGDYDMPCDKDPNRTKLEDSFELFQDLCKTLFNKHKNNISKIIVYFSKFDLFVHKFSTLLYPLDSLPINTQGVTWKVAAKRLANMFHNTISVRKQNISFVLGNTLKEKYIELLAGECLSNL